VGTGGGRRAVSDDRVARTGRRSGVGGGGGGSKNVSEQIGYDTPGFLGPVSSSTAAGVGAHPPPQVGMRSGGSLFFGIFLGGTCCAEGYVVSRV
jgi:hypothetical protein